MAQRIRQLQNGELPCLSWGPPKRYKDGRGYIRLRWRDEDGNCVEIREHQFVMGVPSGVHVHHKNGDKSDNRRENLEIMTPSDHMKSHGRTKPFEAEILRLYNLGLGTPEIGKRLGFNGASIYRRLLKMGVATRNQTEAQRFGVPVEAILTLVKQGYRAKRVAKMIGTSPQTVADIMAKNGIPPFPPGRAKRIR